MKEIKFSPTGKGLKGAYTAIKDYPVLKEGNGFIDYNVNGEVVRKYLPTFLTSGKVVRQFTKAKL